MFSFIISPDRMGEKDIDLTYFKFLDDNEDDLCDGVVNEVNPLIMKQK